MHHCSYVNSELASRTQHSVITPNKPLTYVILHSKFAN